MTTTDKLADALRQAIAATDKQAELLKAGVRDIPCPRDAWREAIAAYDAQQAQPVPAGAWSANAGSVWDHTGKWIADCNRVDAARIVACVNACQGMTLAEIESFGAPGELGRCSQAWVAEDNDNA